MVYRFRPWSALMRAACLTQYEKVPFLVSAGYEYLDEPNAFLRERAIGAWTPDAQKRSEFAKKIKLSKNTIEAYSADLENFFGYIETRNDVLNKASARKIFQAYQSGMKDGTWSADGKSLSPATINRRLTTVSQFLEWRKLEQNSISEYSLDYLSPHELRSPILAKPISNNEARKHGKRPDPKRLRIPTKNEIAIWLEDVSEKHGATKALACQAVIETGMRLEEVVLLRACQLPNLDTILPGRPARMVICYGTKGGRDIDDEEERGKERTLRFEIEFLQKLQSYSSLRRRIALSHLTTEISSMSEPPQLFLSEQNGKPLSKDSVYRAWTSSGKLPYIGFSPHLGRHTFACLTLMRLFKEQHEAMGKAQPDQLRSTMIQSTQDFISVYIKPVLGHVDASTTERYVEWMADHFYVAPSRKFWSDYLEG